MILIRTLFQRSPLAHPMEQGRLGGNQGARGLGERRIVRSKETIPTPERENTRETTGDLGPEEDLTPGIGTDLNQGIKRDLVQGMEKDLIQKIEKDPAPGIGKGLAPERGRDLDRGIERDLGPEGGGLVPASVSEGRDPERSTTNTRSTKRGANHDLTCY